MRIDPQFLKTVAFLCVDDATGKRVAGGTAFFVTVGADGSTYDHLDDNWTSGDTFTYVVTARHCIEDRKDGTPIFVRINIAGGGYHDTKTHKQDWRVHPEADVALMLLRERPENAAIDTIALPLFLGTDGKCRRDFADLLERVGIDSERAEEFAESFKDGIDIGVGDELFFPGLFSQSAGKQRNLPIVRFGNISRMPTEELIKLDTKTRGEVFVRAYLAEMHSWGGHSGSPVFWHLELPLPERYWVRGLLGLVSAHFDVLTDRVSTKETEMKLNSGIAIVTPAENIRELLMDAKVIREREQERVAREKKEPAATPDFVETGDRKTGAQESKRKNRDVEISPISREKFFDALWKATSRRGKK